MIDDAMQQSGAPNVVLEAEDLARADIYALLSSLFYAPPPKELLSNIASNVVLCNDGSVTHFCYAWRALQQAAAQTDAEAVRDEYEAAFIGTGRQPVMLYGSFYESGFLHEKPLVLLREDLTKMGICRRGDRHESEDHVSALCDVMRLLIAGDAETPPAALTLQRDFFRSHIAPWYARLDTTIAGASQTHFYKHVGRLMREFFALEDTAFDMG